MLNKGYIEILIIHGKKLMAWFFAALYIANGKVASANFYLGRDIHQPKIRSITQLIFLGQKALLYNHLPAPELCVYNVSHLFHL